jgi:GDSL-like Lipase/Acylhydrolase family
MTQRTRKLLCALCFGFFSEPTLAVAQIAGSVSAQISNTAAAYDLTALGTSDWTYWNKTDLLTVATLAPANEKAGATSISPMSPVGGTAVRGTNSSTKPPVDFSFSDGTPQLSVTQAQENLIAMIEAIQTHNPNVEIILQTMNSVWDSPTGSNLSATLRPNLPAYYQMYRDVAATRGLMIIDHHPNWASLQQSNTALFQSYITDGVHPGAPGITKVVSPLVQWKLSGGKPLP